MDLRAPVCVVGAGQSGVLVAAKLRELGYEKIDILEARGEIGGYCETATVAGEVYDFQAHLVVQQHFGGDFDGTVIYDLLKRYPVEMQTEALYFVSRSRSGKPRIAVPPHFVPLFETLTPEQVADQLARAWTIIEGALRDRTGPGMSGLAFEHQAGETWESWRARQAPLVGEVLQGLTLYANMRRARQPVETVVNINAHISGHVSQLAKMMLSAYPEQRDELLRRMPESLREQMDSRRPVTVSFRHGFVDLLRRIVADNRLDVAVNSPVTGIESLGPDGVLVSYRSGGQERSGIYSRVVVTARPAQIREMFPRGDIRELFDEQNCPRTWTRSYLIRVGDERIGFPRGVDAAEPLGFWVIDPYGSYTDTDPEQSLHRITAANKQHPGPYWVCFSNSDRSVSDARAWELARESLFLFDDPELITETIAEWPAYPSAAAVRDGWFDRVDAVQGRDGIHFVGEILSGPTVECISSYVHEVIPRWFAGPTPPNDMSIVTGFV